MAKRLNFFHKQPDLPLLNKFAKGKFFGVPCRKLNTLFFMNRVALVLLPAALVLFSGCFEILEEIFLEKGGNGTYLYTIDMSAMMDESMKELLQSSGAGEENSLAGVELDSVVYFKDSNPEEISRLERPEIFERGFMKLLMSDSLDKMVIQFGLKFENVEEIAYFLQNLDKVSGEGMEGGPSLGQGLIPTAETAGAYALKGKKLTRLAAAGMEIEAEDDEMGMMSMVMESATFTTIYHFPGDVKKTSISGAVVEGNTVKVEAPFLDMLKGGSAGSGWVKFK